MADWNLLRGWSDDFIRTRLKETDRLAVSFSSAWDEMTLERGWSHVSSRAVIARAPAGPPAPEGAFFRAVRLLETYAFSDPRVVKAHFDAARPLRGRPILLELRAFGLRYLCPVRSSEAHSASTGDEARFGFSIDTLKGHIERGRERFLLTHDVASGQVRFHIEARWREGDFPNRWSRLGFQLAGRRYQRAWHRLAHLRLRRLLGEEIARNAGEPEPEATPVQWMARRGRRSRTLEIEQEKEQMSRAMPWIGLGLAALSGLRSITPVAALAITGARRGAPPLTPPLARRLPPIGWKALALVELVADKTPWIPARTRPAAVFGRALAGAVIGASFGMRRKGRWLASSSIGAAFAVGATFASYRLRERARRASGLPSAALGLVEDGLVTVASAALARRLIRSAEPTTVAAPGRRVAFDW